MLLLRMKLLKVTSCLRGACRRMSLHDCSVACTPDVSALIALGSVMFACYCHSATGPVHAGVHWVQTSDICLVVCNNHQSHIHSCLCDVCAAQLIDPLHQIATNKLCTNRPDTTAPRDISEVRQARSGDPAHPATAGSRHGCAASNYIRPWPLCQDRCVPGLQGLSLQSMHVPGAQAAPVLEVQAARALEDCSTLLVSRWMGSALRDSVVARQPTHGQCCKELAITISGHAPSLKT